MKLWTAFLVISLMVIYLYKRGQMDKVQGSYVGKLPPLEERVPEHLKEKARARTRALEEKKKAKRTRN